MSELEAELRERLIIYKEAIKVAKEGLRLLADKDPIARATLEEMYKISQKIGKE